MPFKYGNQACELKSHAYAMNFTQKTPFPSKYLKISVSRVLNLCTF